jgi:hypothetical protein
MMPATGAAGRPELAPSRCAGEPMAKKKKQKKAAKPAAKGKARSKKLSVKKRPVKDLDASKAKSLQGGITGNLSPTTRAMNFSNEAIKLGTFQKLS